MVMQPGYQSDTIVAVATPPGEGGIGIVRLSGEKALEIADSIFKARSGSRVSAQKNFSARYGQVSDGPAAIDEALLLVMRGPKSYTGEDTAEISAHGGTAVLQAIVKAALSRGARAAEPGEFTKRAFLNGRMDLLQAEAVLELIHARSEREHAWALSQLEGALSKKMKAWKDELVDILSHLEASVDFPDDFPETDPAVRIRQRLETLRTEAETALKDSELALSVKRGFRIALWGRPNVGKSSLLNRLTRTDRVIVTPYPGTTRDVVEEQASLGGFPVRIQDTAGIRDTEHPIEKEGVERSRKAMTGAELVLLVLDSSEPLGAEDKGLIRELSGKNVIAVLNKSDRLSRLDARDLPRDWPAIPSSCVLEKGTDALESRIVSFITGGRVEIPQQALVQTARQKDLLEKVSKDLEGAAQAAAGQLSGELIASDVRQALDHVGELVGEAFNDDVLEAIFKRFCIGK